jgi:hypothetical protein
MWIYIILLGVVTSPILAEMYALEKNIVYLSFDFMIRVSNEATDIISVFLYLLNKYPQKQIILFKQRCNGKTYKL